MDEAAGQLDGSRLDKNLFGPQLFFWFRGNPAVVGCGVFYWPYACLRNLRSAKSASSASCKSLAIYLQITCYLLAKRLQSLALLKISQPNAPENKNTVNRTEKFAFAYANDYF
jgi:hypothetical protein